MELVRKVDVQLVKVLKTETSKVLARKELTDPWIVQIA
jgi:hypothetical protein